MKKKLVLYLLFPLPFVACDHPDPEKKADMIHLEKVTRDTDIKAEHPGLKFVGGGISTSEFNDERFMQFYDLPVKHLRISIAPDEQHLERLSMDLPKNKEAVNTLKQQLSKTYGQPGGDSSQNFSSRDEGELLVWKNDHQLIGMYIDKDFGTAAKIEHAPTIEILFVKPEETTN